jgi:hypothetical protein
MSIRLSMPTALLVALAIPPLAPSALAAERTRASASALLECRDSALAGMEIAALAVALRDAGGRECRVTTLAWADRVDCERAERLRVAGLPARSISAEVTDGGVRRVVTITNASADRLGAALGGLAPAPGVERAVEAREDGAGLLRCTASASPAAAGTGALAGTLPDPPTGTLGWQVCAYRPSGAAPRCVEVTNAVGWRIAGIDPGPWRVRADPIGGPPGTCALAAEVLADAPGPVPVLAMRPFDVRAGSTTEVGELRIAYGSACRR